MFSEGRWTHDYPIDFVEAKAKNKQMEGGVPLLPYLKKFERIIVIALIVMMAFVILLATIDWLVDYKRYDHPTLFVTRNS